MGFLKFYLFWGLTTIHLFIIFEELLIIKQSLMVQHVIKFIIIFLLAKTSYSQTELKGVYYLKDEFNEFNEFNESIVFKGNKLFEYKAYGSYGISKYGSGEYNLNKEILTLTFGNSVSRNHSSYKIMEEKNSFKDSIVINLIVKDSIYFIPQAEISINNEIRFESDHEGKANFKLLNKNDSINILVKRIGSDQVKFRLKSHKNYFLEVYLYDFSGIQIKGRVINYFITKKSENCLELKDEFGKNQLWEKQ